MPDPLSRRDSHHESHDPSPTKPYQAKLTTSSSHPIHPTTSTSTPAQNTVDGSQIEQILGFPVAVDPDIPADPGWQIRSTTEATDQVRPVVDSVARIDIDIDIDLDEIEREHRAVEWQRCDSDGVPNPEKPLPPFCAACTDEEYVGAIEYGDTIDEGADVVSWPCDLVELAAEVRQLRDQVAELEALRSADIAVIGKLGAAVPRAEAERDAALAQVAAARRALLQGGQLAEIRCRAALVALDDGRG